MRLANALLIYDAAPELKEAQQLIAPLLKKDPGEDILLVAAKLESKLENGDQAFDHYYRLYQLSATNNQYQAGLIQTYVKLKDAFKIKQYSGTVAQLVENFYNHPKVSLEDLLNVASLLDQFIRSDLFVFYKQAALDQIEKLEPSNYSEKIRPWLELELRYIPDAETALTM